MAKYYTKLTNFQPWCTVYSTYLSVPIMLSLWPEVPEWSDSRIYKIPCLERSTLAYQDSIPPSLTTYMYLVLQGICTSVVQSHTMQLLSNYCPSIRCTYHHLCCTYYATTYKLHTVGTICLQSLSTPATYIQHYTAVPIARTSHAPRRPCSPIPESHKSSDRPTYLIIGIVTEGVSSPILRGGRRRERERGKKKRLKTTATTSNASWSKVPIWQATWWRYLSTPLAESDPSRQEQSLCRIRGPTWRWQPVVRSAPGSYRYLYHFSPLG
jgi:hypothetical protein